jgi:DNA-binding transcriptional regulator YiaG
MSIKPFSTTGEDLLAAREELGLTQAQMASELGVSTRLVRYWEKGDRKFRRFVVLAYLHLLSKQRM